MVAAFFMRQLFNTFTSINCSSFSTKIIFHLSLSTMKFVLTLLSLALLTQYSFAQDEIRTKKLSFGIFASPDASFRSLAGNTGTS
jgi:hypothetical protein